MALRLETAKMVAEAGTTGVDKLSFQRSRQDIIEGFWPGDVLLDCFTAWASE